MLRRLSAVANDAVLVEFLQRLGRPVAAHVLRRGEGAHPAFEQRPADEVGLSRLARPYRDVGRTHADVDLIIVQDQLDADLGVKFAKLRQPLRQPDRAEADRRRDAQLAGGLRRRVRQQSLGRLQLVDDVRDRAVQKLALLGEHQAARVAVKEYDPQVALERRDLTAHGRLAHVQGIARMREAACLSRRVKNPKLVPIHDGSNPGGIGGCKHESASESQAARESCRCAISRLC